MTHDGKPLLKKKKKKKTGALGSTQTPSRGKRVNNHTHCTNLTWSYACITFRVVI